MISYSTAGNATGSTFRTALEESECVASSGWWPYTTTDDIDTWNAFERILRESEQLIALAIIAAKLPPRILRIKRTFNVETKRAHLVAGRVKFLQPLPRGNLIIGRSPPG